MKKIVLIFLILLFTYAHGLKVGVLMPFGSKKDPTFGYMVKKGIELFSEKYSHIDIEIAYPSPGVPFTSYLKYFSLKSDYIIAAGFMYKEALYEQAKKNIDVKYFLVDSYVDLPNVCSIVFDDYQAAFVAGVMTAKFFANWNLAFIGASPSFLSDNFYYGFFNGLRYQGYDKDFEKYFISNEIVGFVNPQKGRALADKLFSKDTDLIFAPSGASSIGVLQSAVKNEKFVIGIDRPFEDLSENGVVFSLSKRIDKALYKVLYQSIIENDFQSRKVLFDFSNGGYEIPYRKRLERVYGYYKMKWYDEFIQKVINDEIVY